MCSGGKCYCKPGLCAEARLQLKIFSCQAENRQLYGTTDPTPKEDFWCVGLLLGPTRGIQGDLGGSRGIGLRNGALVCQDGYCMPPRVMNSDLGSSADQEHLQPD